MNVKELQIQFSESLLYQHDNIINQIKTVDNISAKQRLQVYRNSFIMGTIEALSITYQHTHSLVGEEFFNAVSRQFILENPPIENNIMIYGEALPNFLETLSQLSSMPYISEMARFEWFLEQTSNTPVQDDTLDLDQLSKVPEEDLGKLQFKIPKQITIFKSTQNIFHLYQMLIENNVTETDLNTHCYLALKKQPDFKIELITLEKDEYLLLHEIKKGKKLASITLSLHSKLSALLEKTLLNGFFIN